MFRARSTRFMGGAGCTALALVVSMFAVVSATAADRPVALDHQVQPLQDVAALAVPSVDREAVRVEDEAREAQGLAPRFAIPNTTFITPLNDGTWESIDASTSMWRIHIESPGALSINLGFTRYTMPEGGKLYTYAADGSYIVGPYTADDNEVHGQLWTPVVLGDDIVVEVTLPTAVKDRLDLELTEINVGYRFFGEQPSLRSGACNNDVVCPVGDDWRDEIPSVAVISTGGSLFCTGFMVNNTAEDETPYFMTANHCGIYSGNAASLVVYWNFESPTCGQHGGGSLADNQTGSFFRASYSTSDFTLVELDSMPNPDWNVSYAGWDHSSADATSAVGIHHPNTDEKSISFEYDPTTTTSWLGTSVPGNGSHVCITDWDDGTTEPGSSGSPLFDQNHHVIGQLHGGYAACGNNLSDWYGRFSMSWTGGGSNSSRLSNWLDPGNTGLVSVDTLVPGASGIRVTPPDSMACSGPIGGPFNPPGRDYVIENNSDYAVNYSVTKSQPWLTITNGSGTIPANDTVTVTVSVNSNADSLGEGTYNDSIDIVNTTDHDGDTARNAALQVGGPAWDPVASYVGAQTSVSQGVNIALNATDPNGDTLGYVIAALPSSGYLSDPGAGPITSVPYELMGNGDVVTYQPPCGLVLNDGFTYFVHDATADSNMANVAVAVTADDPRLVYSFPMDSDPGWTTEANWAFGAPTGGGTHNGDPTSGYTGSNVYGYNLDGDYANNRPAYALTTTAIDCSELTSTSLRFRRWLGVERYDDATVQVSNDGSSWTTIWDNPTSTNVDESAWSLQTYDISALADGQPTIYIRWNMGVTDGSVTFPGWNIDDVEVWGIVPIIPTDFNGDGLVTLDDLAELQGCMTGPGGSVDLDCLCIDVDGDNDVDLGDFSRLQLQFTQ